MKLFYSKHAIQRIFERNITIEEIEHTIENGITVKDYPDDKPYPSKLVLSTAGNQPLHVVFALHEEKCVIITAYRPDLYEWNEDFITKRKQMTCLICKTGTYKSGFTTVVLTKGDSAIIIKQVPAEVCDQCGEYILSDEVTKKIMSMANEAWNKGSEVEIIKYAA